jgi:tRNA nucleotidyltransferase (CCA-adding enzyme)
MIYSKIIDDLQNNGANCFLCGGAVRDSLLGITPHDYDFLITTIDEKLFDDLLKKHGEVYKSIITPGLRKVLVRDSDIDFSYCGNEDIVEHIRNIFDFTCNSLFHNMKDKVLQDNFGGKEDMEHKILRMIGRKTDLINPAYPGFAVMPLRAARFCAQLDFIIEPETFAFLRKCAETMFDLTTKERRAMEIYKIFSRDNVKVAIDVLMKLNIFDRLYTEYEY